MFSIMNIDFREQMAHILYTRGKLLSTADRGMAIERMASMTSKTKDQIEERLLSGKRKRIKSSKSLSKLMRLEVKLKAAGFDVYIDPKS